MMEEHEHLDGEEFTRLMLQNQRRIMGLILSLVPNGPDADDILQETCAVMWRKFDEFEPGTNFAAWALRIARYQVMSHYTRQKRQRARLSDETIEAIADRLADPAQVARTTARSEALQSCLGKLKDRQLELIRRRYHGDEKVEEIADAMDSTVHAIYKSLNRLHLSLFRCVQSTMKREQTV